MKTTKKVLSLLLGALLAINASAIRLELPEAGVRVEKDVDAILSEDAGLVRFDTAKGELVYFNNFSDAAYSKSGFAFDIIKDGGTAASNVVIDEPSDALPFLESNAGHADTNPFYIADRDDQTYGAAGKLTFAGKVYCNSTAKVGSFIRSNKNDDGTDWSFQNTAEYGKWVSFSKSWNVSDFASVDIGTYSGDADMRKYIFDDIAVWYKPSNALILMSADGTDGETVMLSETYELKTPYELGYGTEDQVWVDADAHTFAADTYAADALAGVVLFVSDAPKPAESAAAPARYDDACGELVFFTNFSGSGDITTADIGIKANNYAEKKTFDNYTTLKCGESKISPVTVGIEVEPNGEKWQYADGRPLTGRLTMYAELYVDNDSASKHYTVAAPGSDWGGYWTSWSVKDNAGARAWSKTYSSAVNPASYTSFGMLSDNWKTEYCRALAVYVIPDNGFWLAADEKDTEPTLYFFDDTTFELPTSYKGADVGIWMIGSKKYDAGSIVNTSEIAGKKVYPYMPPKSMEAPADYSAAYGQLIYFTNFSDSGAVSLADIGIKASTYAEKTLFDNYTALKCGQSKLSPNTIGIEVEPNGGKWQYADGTPIEGQLTMYASLYVDDAAAPGRFTVAAPGADWGGYWTSWTLSGNAGAKAWSNTYSSAVNPVSYTNFGLLSNNWKTEYCRALGVYVKNPTNALWLTSDDIGSNRTFYVMTDGTFTMPAAFNGASVDKWTDGTAFYTVGESYTKAEIGGKTLHPYVATKYADVPALTLEGKGELIWFENFNAEGTGFTNKAAFDVLLKGAPATRLNYYCVSTKEDTLSPNTVGIEIKPASGKWEYLDGTPIMNKITVVAEVYCDMDSVPQIYTVAHNDTTSEWGKYYTPWDKPWGSNGNAVKQWVPITSTALNGSDYDIVGFLTNKWGDFYVRSIAVYAESTGIVVPEKNTSIRVAAPTGLRFAAFVDEKLRASADEYGFIAALASDTVHDDPSKLGFNAAGDKQGTNEDGVKYSSGVCYDKNGTDLIFATDGTAFGSDLEGYYFTCVLTGIDAANYSTKIAVRPYLVIGGKYIYGKVTERSLYDAANALKNAGYTNLSDTEKAFVNGIIETVEK